MKIQATAWDIIVINHIFIKELAAWIYKELSKLKSKETTNAVKNGQNISADTSFKKTNGWQVNTWNIVNSSHQRNINEHHSELSLHRMAKEQLIIPGAGEHGEQLQLSCIAAGKAEEYRCCGKQVGSVL